MPLPVAHVLFGTAIAEGILPKNRPRRVLLVAAALSLLPDLDFFLVWGLGMERSWHRGFTHSIVFALALGTLSLVSRAAPTRVCIAWALALLSHGVLDWATTLRGPGVEIWWPFSVERFRWGALSLFEFSGPDPYAPFAAISHVLHDSAIEALFFLPLLALSRMSPLRKLQ